MYLPTAFREDRTEFQHELIRTHPLGLIVTHGAAGLIANPLPFLLYAGEAGKTILRAHFARANPHWKEFASAQDCLIVFQGPQAYITPSWYATKRENGKVVPTWNYVTVHVWGTARTIDDAAWLLRLVNDLTDSQEQRRPAPWKVSDAPDEFVAMQLRAIVGIEIEVSRIEGKWKLSQNRTEVDRGGVVEGRQSEFGAGDVMASLVAAKRSQ
jgi:transcriptional regulator